MGMWDAQREQRTQAAIAKWLRSVPEARSAVIPGV